MRTGWHIRETVAAAVVGVLGVVAALGCPGAAGAEEELGGTPVGLGGPGWERALSFGLMRGGISSVYAANADGSGAKLLVADAGTPRWSPDGARLAVLAGQRQNLVVRDVRLRPRTLAREVEDWGFGWSPDGTRLAYSQGRGIVTVRPDGSDRRLLTSGEDSRPVWSPDGTRIAFARGSISENALYVVGSDGSGERKLADDPLYVAWAPGGRQLAFSDAEGVHVLDVDGDQRRKLSSDDFAEVAWSPDGRRLAIGSSYPPGGLTVVGPDGAGRRAYLRGRSIDDVEWSPDARLLAAVADGDVLVLDLAGRHVRVSRRFVGLAAVSGREDLAWHPRGLPAARLHGTPARGDIRIHDGALGLGGAVVEGLDAVGVRAAVLARDLRSGCGWIGLWDRRRSDAAAWSWYGVSCLTDEWEERLYDLTVSGSRATWLDLYASHNGYGVTVRAASLDDLDAPPAIITSFDSLHVRLVGEGGRLFAVVTDDGSSTLWRLGERRARIRSFNQPVTPFATRDERVLVSTRDGRLLLVGPRGTIEWAIRFDRGAVRAARFSGRRVVVQTGHAITLWKIGSTRPAHSWRSGPTATLEDVDEHQIVSVTSGAIHVLDVDSARRTTRTAAGRPIVRLVDNGLLVGRRVAPAGVAFLPDSPTQPR